MTPAFRVSHIIRALKLSHSQLKRGAHGGLKKVPVQTQFIKLPEENDGLVEINEGSKTTSLTLKLEFSQGAHWRLSGELSATILSSLVQTLCHAQAAENGGEV